MPIPEQELERSFIAIDGDVTVSELRDRVRQLSTPGRYLIIALPTGAYTVCLLTDVARAVEGLGSAALDLPVARLPGIGEPGRAVERTSMGFGMAQRERDRQPQRRLVVLEGDEPIGLLINENRGGGDGGLPFQLFGDYIRLSNQEVQGLLEKRHAPRVCPYCQAQFTFYALRPDINAFACPSCGQTL